MQNKNKKYGKILLSIILGINILNASNISNNSQEINNKNNIIKKQDVKFLKENLPYNPAMMNGIPPHGIKEQDRKFLDEKLPYNPARMEKISTHRIKEQDRKMLNINEIGKLPGTNFLPFLKKKTTFKEEKQNNKKEEEKIKDKKLELFNKILNLDLFFKEQLQKYIDNKCGKTAINKYKKEIEKGNKVIKELTLKVQTLEKQLEDANKLNTILLEKYKTLFNQYNKIVKNIGNNKNINNKNGTKIVNNVINKVKQKFKVNLIAINTFYLPDNKKIYKIILESSGQRYNITIKDPEKNKKLYINNKEVIIKNVSDDSVTISYKENKKEIIKTLYIN